MIQGPANIGTSISTTAAYVNGDAIGPYTLTMDSTLRVTCSVDSAVIAYVRSGSTAANAISCSMEKGNALVANSQYAWELGFPKGTVVSVRFSGACNINNLNMQNFTAR